ncbi:TetR/AcrR family transcriptional regulator [Paralcaligenes ginsengisoli]
MKLPTALDLKPRKTPRQARSEVTVDVIFQAAIQVLLAGGPYKLTTTRVAERAGVSVGTLYQYFPHKQALLYAVLQRHLNGIAAAVEAACEAHQGDSVSTMVDSLVAAYIDAKAVCVPVSKVLYKVAAELEVGELRGEISKRIHHAIVNLLQNATNTKFDDAPAVAFTMQAAMTGTARAVFESGATPAMLNMLRSQLALMCKGYVLSVAKPGGTSR